MASLLNAGWPMPGEKVSRVNGMITCLHSITNEPTDEKLLVGGVDDGSIVLKCMYNRFLGILNLFAGRWCPVDDLQ